VDDPTGCLDDTLVEAELESVLGLAFADLDVDVTVTGDPHESRGIHIRVNRSGEETTALRRTLQVEPVDCPLAHTVIARSVQRGLEALPGWSWGRGAPERTWGTARLGTSAGTGPGLLAGELSLGVSFGLPGRLRLPVEVTGSVTGFTDVGTGQAQILAATIAAGLAVEAGQPWLWPRVLLEGGVGRLRGRNYQTNHGSTIPRLSTRLGVDIGLAPVAGLTIDAVVPLFPADLVEVGTSASVSEPPLRMGIGACVRW
jgi:hypothetical protein